MTLTRFVQDGKGFYYEDELKEAIREFLDRIVAVDVDMFHAQQVFGKHLTSEEAGQ